MNIPCKNCIVFPMCKPKYTQVKDVVDFYFSCELLREYIEKDPYQYGVTYWMFRAERERTVNNIFTGAWKDENAM